MSDRGSKPLTPVELEQQTQLLALGDKTLTTLCDLATKGLAEDTRSQVTHVLAVEINGELSPFFQTITLVAAVLRLVEDKSHV